MDLRVKPQEWGAAVRAERLERLLTQAEVAAQIGVSLRTVQNWETTDAEPKMRHRRAILEWLNRKEAA